jgi:hypothetical protein
MKPIQMLTMVEIDEAKLWNGAKVRCPNGLIKEIMVLPKDKTISQAVKEGLFDLNKHVELEMVLLNRTRFELINDED